MVGALLVKAGRVIGRGWHRQAGQPHAEIEALSDARRQGRPVRGATLYVTLEPCSTHGRTAPCTEAIVSAGLKRVVVGATDPNPRHRGRAFTMLRRAGIRLQTRVLTRECAQLNEAFNHWIVHHTPLVTVKAAMTLDGKIATPSGESKWITGEKARAYGMELRRGADAILVGINTVLADDPSLTVRGNHSPSAHPRIPQPKRIVLDAQARTPLTSKLVSDQHSDRTIIVVSRLAPKNRVAALAKRVRVLAAPVSKGRSGRATRLPPGGLSSREAAAAIDLVWLLKQLGQEDITHLLVEGGGEVNASFLLSRLAHRVAFFYAPKVLGGRNARRAVAGDGAANLHEILQLQDLRWRRLGPDLLLSARVTSTRGKND
jgi:diaminohydroxyphosphoribosylaminopyrimidine deaminase/5-amino-6-(5-phosphoribosylamino)uracil reductase